MKQFLDSLAIAVLVAVVLAVIGFVYPAWRTMLVSSVVTDVIVWALLRLGNRL